MMRSREILSYDFKSFMWVYKTWLTKRQTGSSKLISSIQTSKLLLGLFTRCDFWTWSVPNLIGAGLLIVARYNLSARFHPLPPPSLERVEIKKIGENLFHNKPGES